MHGRELRNHLLVVQYGASNQVWKIGDEQQVLRRISFAGIATVNVSEIRNLRKREERYAERKRNLQAVEIRASDGVERIDPEIGVFVVGQRRNIRGNGSRK
jgi:hypothetical protein